MLMRLGEPGVIVSDLCHKRNIFPPPCAHPAPLLEDLFDCKVVLAELSLFKLSIWTQDILSSFLFWPHNHYYLTLRANLFLTFIFRYLYILGRLCLSVTKNDHFAQRNLLEPSGTFRSLPEPSRTFQNLPEPCGTL